VHQTESSELDLKRYLNLLLRKKRLFVLCAGVIITAFVAASYLLPKEYEAKSTVFIERNVINSLVEGIAVTPSMEERLRVLAYSMKSRNLLLKVIEELGIDIKSMNNAEAEGIIENYQRKTDISIRSDRRGDSGMDLFIVSFRDRDPEMARDYVNTLVRRYIEENLSAKREEAYGANRFLSEQIGFFKDKIDSMESEIVNFRKEKGIFIATDERTMVEEIKRAQERIDEIGIQRMELKARKGLIDKQLKEENPYTVTVFGRGSNTMAGRLAMLQNQLNQLLTNYTENYPEVIKVRAEIEALKEMMKSKPEGGDDALESESAMSSLNPLYQQLKEEMSKIELELAALNAKEQNLRQMIEQKKGYMREIPEEKKKLTDLERERDTNREIYEQLVLKHGQSEVSKQMEIQDKTTTFRISDPAVLPTKPASPNRVKIILLGIFAGIAGGMGSVIFLDYIDRSIKSVAEIRSLGLPVLAVVPHMQSSEEVLKERRNDLVLYGFSGLYALCVMVVLALEVLR